MPKMVPNKFLTKGSVLVLYTGSHYLQQSSRLTESDQILLKKIQGLKKFLNGEKAPNLVTLGRTCLQTKGRSANAVR